LVFGGDTHALIPLYSVGVFVTFTLAQTGMVIHWAREHPAGWRWKAALNGIGAVLTGVVLVVVASVKFADGAYLVVILTPVLVGLMLFVNRQYRSTNRQVAVRPDFVVVPTQRAHRSIVPVPGINRAVIQAVNVGRSISPDT